MLDRKRNDPSEQRGFNRDHQSFEKRATAYLAIDVLLEIGRSAVPLPLTTRF